jgi:hypothetical protein
MLPVRFDKIILIQYCMSERQVHSPRVGLTPLGLAKYV